MSANQTPYPTERNGLVFPAAEMRNPDDKDQVGDAFEPKMVPLDDLSSIKKTTSTLPPLTTSASKWTPPPPPDRNEVVQADNPLITGAVDNTAFDAAEHKHVWIVEELLVANEPCVLAAPSKTMKTALAVDLAVSVAAGKPFLDRFKVPKARPVYVISCESGAASLQARMRQVCRSKGIRPAGLPIQWFTQVESLSTVEGCRNLEAALRHFRSEVVELDPSYLLFGGEVTADKAGNMFAMGALLANVGAACLNAGATCMVLTHANSRLPIGEVMELSHIAWSGFQQWARQWWLMSRRAKYEDDGRHLLNLRYGGSAGHTGLVHIDIDEGTFDPFGGGKKWQVTTLDGRRPVRHNGQPKRKRH